MSNSFRPMDCNLPGSSVHRISQARVLEWVAIFFSMGSLHPGIKPSSPALAGGFFITEPPGKPTISHTILNISGEKERSYFWSWRENSEQFWRDLSSLSRDVTWMKAKSPRLPGTRDFKSKVALPFAALWKQECFKEAKTVTGTQFIIRGITEVT